MSKLTCDKCNYVFTTKYGLDKHQNKKIKCDIKTEFKCKVCNKCFKQKKNLTEHVEKNICKKNNMEVIKDNNGMVENDILNIINSKILDNQKKITFLNKLGLNITLYEFEEILNSKLPHNTIITLIKGNNNKVLNNQTNINNSNNTNFNNTNSNNTNNIQINAFGNESIDYLDNKFFSNLLQNNYGKDSFLKLSNEIYLNKEKPENNTIKIDNLNNKYCKIIENNKWITTTKDTALKKIFLNVSDIILLILDDVKDKVPEKRREIIANYLEKDVDDEYIKETLTELILKIYNFSINDLKN